MSSDLTHGVPRRATPITPRRREEAERIASAYKEDARRFQVSKAKRDRMILKLRADDVSVREIAAIFDCSPQTVVNVSERAERG